MQNDHDDNAAETQIGRYPIGHNKVRHEALHTDARCNARAIGYLMPMRIWGAGVRREHAEGLKPSLNVPGRAATRPTPGYPQWRSMVSKYANRFKRG
jgi:hypothetical protein